MKKLLLWVFGFAIIWLFGQVFAIRVALEWKNVAYFNMYKNQFDVNLEIKDWKVIYNNNLLNKDLVPIMKKNQVNNLAVKLKVDIEWWNYNTYIWEVYNLWNNLNQYNELGIAKMHPYTFLIEKPNIILYLSRLNLKKWVNNLVMCYSTNLSSMDFKKFITPFKYAFCSTPVKLYYYNWKIFLDEAKYNEYKKSVDDEQAKSINSKLDFIKKKLDYYKISWWIQKVENYIKEYTDKNYKSTLSNIEKQRILFNLKNEIYKKFWFYNWKIIVPNILSKEDIYFVTDYYYNLYTKQIDNNYYSQVNQKEQYKSEALSNYWELQKRYNQLKQEYEQYKLKTAENRQRAIKLTVVLTKILSKYHDKETKLKVLDQIDQIIETKYWPDKFKNQDLIWYVKDYLKIIRLAIQLSE